MTDATDLHRQWGAYPPHSEVTLTHGSCVIP